MISYSLIVSLLNSHLPTNSATNPVTAAPPSITPLGHVTLSKIAASKKYTEYITNLRAVKHGLPQSFTVYIFLGDFNPDPSTWPFELHMVGRFTVLGNQVDSNCGKCVNDANDSLVVTGTVPLTSALLQDIKNDKLASLDRTDVEAYLERNLHWRVVAFDGSQIDRATVPGLKVSVCSTNVDVGDDSVPIYSGQYTLHTGVTDGRPAGHSGGDQI
jgi:tyrosinase